ncbi:metalloendopeptidase [Aureococcus anophagefferens]|nr:metalloendopeptidase [Aureococcus anophagefferens]
MSTLDASETATEGEAAPAINVCAACGAEAKMACPQCVKLKQKEPAGFDGGGFGVVYFCTQDCFKANWSAHKKSHKPWAAAIDTGQPTSEQMEKRNRAIRVYSAKDIAGIREVCKIGRKVLDAAGRAVGLGVTTAEVDRVTYETTVEHGGYPSPLNYYDFPCSVCTSVNEVICHGIPDLRPLEEGDVVNVDVSVYYGGYHGDLNETFVVGKGAARTTG